jgi:hypothetical protein
VGSEVQEEFGVEACRKLLPRLVRHTNKLVTILLSPLTF